MSLAKRVKAIRMDFKMTQEEFAEKLGLKVFSISRYETGSRYPDSRTLQKFREIYLVNINWLLTGKGSMFGDGKQKAAYKVGDIVELISGSKPMTIIQADSKDVTCTWPNANDDLQTAVFPIVAVKLIK